MSSVLKAMVLHLQSLKYKEITVTQNNVEIRKTYYLSGALWWVTPYVNRERHGTEKLYYETGSLEWETPYVNGKKDGVEKYYAESGALRIETPYKGGYKQGIEKTYYESGALWYETPYKDGIRHGIAKNYDKDNQNINCLILYKRSHEVLTICLESYKRLYI